MAELVLLSDAPDAVAIAGRGYEALHPRARAAWEHLLQARKDCGVCSARELYEGSVGGDATYLVDAFALEMGTHPLREVQDWSVYDDNGSVVLYFGRGQLAVPADTALLVVARQAYEPRGYLPDPVEPPGRFDIDGEPELVVPHSEHGQFVLVPWHEHGLTLVGWRGDGRERRDIRAIGCHGNAEFALHAIRTVYDAGFEPPEKRRNRPNRDYQRTKVYMWQPGACGEELGEAEAQRLVDDIFADLGMDRPPKVTVTARRTSSSAAKFNEILLAEGWGQDKRVVVHEAAHIVARRASDRRISGHGPEFVGVYVRLLERWCGMDAHELLARAERLGVDCELPGWWPHPAGSDAAPGPR